MSERYELVRMHCPSDRLEVRTKPGVGHVSTTLGGYAAVFDQPTVIDNWEGKFVEQFAPGAFTKTLKDRGDSVKLLFDHGMDPSIGNKPLGAIRSISEDDIGLRVEADLLDRPYAQDIAAAIKGNAIDGMSFRFSVIQEDWDDAEEPPVRTVREAKLHEVSVVTFPAYEATKVGVRSREGFKIFREWAAERHPPEEVRAAVEAPAEVEDKPQQHLSPVEPSEDLLTRAERSRRGHEAADLMAEIQRR